MFKIHENGDGSTSIFCNKTGKLICTIGSQQKNMGLGGRPVNVVEPSPKPRSCCYNLDLKPECLSDEDEKEESRKKCESPLLEDYQENFSDDCITQENFVRCLNLIPCKKLETESLDELRTTFPLRQLSRTKASRASEDLQDVKLPDDVPLTSSLGVSVLKINEQKNFYNDQTIQMKIKHYDSFCSFQFNSPSACSNFPKLRYREKKEYPVCIPQKILKFSPAHIYAFNKRQRLEKMLTFKTGLSTRSRKLLLKCNKRLAVSLRRMASEEIATWLEKKPRIIGSITLDCGKDEPSSVGSDSDATVIEQSSHFCIDLESTSSSTNNTDLSVSDPSVVFPSKQILSFKGVLSDTNSNSFSLRSKDHKLIKRNFQKYEQCCVKVINVLKLIHKYYGDYYVKGTNIRIPFLSDYLNSLDQKHLSAIIIPDANSTNSRYDHAYHRPFSQAVAKKKFVSNSNCLSLKSSKTRTDVKDTLKVNNSIKNKSMLNSKHNSVENSDSLKLSVNNTVSKSNDIPVIDLTSDSAPNSPVKGNKTVQKVGNNVSNWQFHCYGCGYKKMFIEELAANSSANKHMKDFHCVSDPKSFLQVTHSVSGSALEAFPGYKRNWTE